MPRAEERQDDCNCVGSIADLLSRWSKSTLIYAARGGPDDRNVVGSDRKRVLQYHHGQRCRWPGTRHFLSLVLRADKVATTSCTGYFRNAHSKMRRSSRLLVQQVATFAAGFLFYIYLHREDLAYRPPLELERPRDDILPASESGVFEVDVETIPSTSELVEIAQKSNLQPGGLWRPASNSLLEGSCKGQPQRSKVAILIPYRNRPLHLPILLKYIHPFLQRQNLDYGVYVVEQNDSLPFNRASLFNTGVVEALRDKHYTCFVFHDVDHIPSDNRISYCCADDPLHLSTNVDRWKYKLLYPEFLGGVTQFGRVHVDRMNGMSNAYWGWGGEDDDILCRWRTLGMQFKRPPDGIGRYRTIGGHGHKSADKNPERFEKLKMARSRMNIDGMNSIRYKRTYKKLHPLYTHLGIRLVSQNDTSVMVKPPNLPKDTKVPHWSCQ